MDNEKFILTTLISSERIKERISSLAEEIDRFFQGDHIIVLGVLKGALFFMSDLLKEMKTDLAYDFIQAKSYEGTTSSGIVRILKDPSLELKGKKLLIVEDILDTGITLNGIIEYLKKKDPEQIYVCTLLDKRGRRVVNAEADFTGFQIDNLFVVGYGLDYNERFRNLKDVCVLEIKS